MATFSTSERKLRPRGDRKSYEFTQHLQKTFEAAILIDSYPNSQIDIFCEILQADGGNLAACINAATLALVDAGVALKGDWLDFDKSYWVSGARCCLEGISDIFVDFGVLSVYPFIMSWHLEARGWPMMMDGGGGGSRWRHKNEQA